LAGPRAVGDYDGRERTLDVFNADARDQLDLLTRFRDLRPEIEAALGGPIIVLFHTTTEMTRLYPEMVARYVEQQMEAWPAGSDRRAIVSRFAVSPEHEPRKGMDAGMPRGCPKSGHAVR